MHLLTLSEHWHIRALQSFEDGRYPSEHGWLPTPIPAHWQQLPALREHVGKVVYRCRFSYPGGVERPAPDARFWLKLNGVFYWSRAYLNGVDLGRHEGYFIPYEREITAQLADENTLFVEVDCPDERDKFGKRMITGVFSHWDCIEPDTNPGGIWLPVVVERSGPVRLHQVRCHSESFDEHIAQVRYTVDLDARVAGPLLLRWRIEPRTFAGAVQVIEQRRVVRAGRQEFGGMFKLRDPQLWWTHDFGNPDLYTITLEVLIDEVLSDSHSFGFGVRRFELRDWIPHLNGVRFLIKGNNYPPGDVRIATMNAERVALDLKLARECHMNLLRVHAHVDHPALYEEADAAGILLWQDFPLQWLYRAEVMEEAKRQARAMVRLLYNHPSVAIWCMHNEPVFLADTSDERLITRLRTYQSFVGFSWNRDVLDTQLKRIVEREDMQRPVVRSSGEMDVPRYRIGTDAHAYFGWYSSYGTLRDAEVMRQRFPGNMRFMTEFGTQSFPNLESSLKFIPAEVKDIDVERLVRSHGLQAAIMDNWIPWREAPSLAELIDLTQDYQIFINRYYIDRLRLAKYRPTGGIVPFIFVDAYPAVLWSIIDYWRVPKRSYYAMRMAFSPQYAFSVFEPRTYRVAEAIELPLYVVNDQQQPANGLRLTARLRDPAGALLAEISHTIDLEADSHTREIDRLRLIPPRSGRYALEIQLSGGADEIRQIYEIAVE